MVGWLPVVRLFRQYSRTLHYNEIDGHLNDVMGLKLYVYVMVYTLGRLFAGRGSWREALYYPFVVKRNNSLARQHNTIIANTPKLVSELLSL